MKFRPPSAATRTYIHTPCNACNACNAWAISGRNGCNGCNAQGRRNVHNRGSCGDRVRRVLTFVGKSSYISWHAQDSFMTRETALLAAGTHGGDLRRLV